MRRAALATVCFALVPASASADRLAATRQQPLREVSHAVTVRIDDGVARYRVRRTFANAGTQAEQAELRVDLPHAAAVTGLRIRARDRWFSGELMERDEARRKYQELTGLGSWEAKDPALLEWVWADQAELRVFPVLAGSIHTVEYTLTAPLEYAGGRYVLSYPVRSTATGDAALDTLPLAEPVLTFEPGYGDAQLGLRIDGQRVAAGAPVVLRAPAVEAWLGDGMREPGAGYAVVPVAVERDEPVTAAQVSVEIDHTYSGDLRVELLTPDGHLFEVTRGEDSTNDLRGTFEVDFPLPRASAGRWALVVSDHAGLDVGTLDAFALELRPVAEGASAIRAAATGLPAFIPDAQDGEGDGGLVRLELDPPKIGTVAARLGRAVASDTHGFSRLEVDVAPVLRPLPVRASVVFVIDVSLSVPQETVDEQLRIASATLSHVPDAHVEVVVFDRGARRLFGSFVPAPDFESAVASARAASGLDRHNGSALEAGLRLAAEVLADRRGPARIVALTDAELRSRFSNAQAQEALRRSPRRSVTHLVIPELGSEASILRDDDHALAPIAAEHGGILVHMTAPEDEKARTLARVALPLVRPVAIDHFAIEGLDLSGAPSPPESFGEGEGYRAMLALASPPRRVVLSGKIWAEPFRRVVRTTDAFDTATAAFVFSEDEHGDLSHEEMLRIAFKGKAVSPVTSYLATEPGVRPSTEGFPDEGTLGLGGLGLVGHGGGGGVGAISRPPPELSDLFAAAARACEDRIAPVSGWIVELEVETTEREIVDVIEAKATHAGMTTCIVESIWATALPEASWPSRALHRLTFDG
jgi:Mg-chelatase subunit ChlD